MFDKWKDRVTNIVAVVVAVGTAIQLALEGVPDGSEWYSYVLALAVGIVAYLTGKK